MKATNNDSVPGEPKPRKRPGRVPVSCAECRRLKMRCDRKVPCENCTKKGCASICPNGQLTTGRGNRMILANTEELHEKIDGLCGRIRDLETALRVLQHSVSTQPHPLLREDLLQLKSPFPNISENERTLNSADAATSVSDEERPLFDSFGTLSYGVLEETSFVGDTARADILLEMSKPGDIEKPRRHPSNISDCSWPEFPSVEDDRLRELVIGYLPSKQRACKMTEDYLEHSKWLGTIVTREEAYEHLIHPLYRDLRTGGVGCPHRLSLVFMIFALSTLWDPHQEPYSPEAQYYYNLARASLASKSPLTEGTIRCVQALLLMVQYLDHIDTPKDTAQSWAIMGNIVKLALSMGLNLDSSKWTLSRELSQRRHRVFWNMATTETIMSHNFGRPPIISDWFVDCPLPEDDVDESGNRVQSCSSWTFEFGRSLRTVLTGSFCTKSPTYSQILEFDRHLRSLAVPPNLALDVHDHDGFESPDVVMQRVWVFLLRENALLSLHKSFLVQALTETPKYPMEHKYSESVVACCKSAYGMVEGLSWALKKAPQYVLRTGRFFALALSAAVVMCIVVTRSPLCSLAGQCIDHLDTVCDLLQTGSSRNRLAYRNLNLALKLRQKANTALHRAMSESLQGPSGIISETSGSSYPYHPNDHPNDNTRNNNDDEDENNFDLEFDRLSGKTTLIPWPIMDSQKHGFAKSAFGDGDGQVQSQTVLLPPPRELERSIPYGQSVVEGAGMGMGVGGGHHHPHHYHDESSIPMDDIDIPIAIFASHSHSHSHSNPHLNSNSSPSPSTSTSPNDGPFPGAPLSLSLFISNSTTAGSISTTTTTTSTLDELDANPFNPNLSGSSLGMYGSSHSHGHGHDYGGEDDEGTDFHHHHSGSSHGMGMGMGLGSQWVPFAQQLGF